jgi:cyclomaltodextrinase
VDGGSWHVDPAAKSEDDGNGNMNSVLLVLPPGYETPAKRGDGKITFEAVRHDLEPPARNYDRGKLRLTVVVRAGDVSSVDVNFAGKSYPMRPAGDDEIEERFVADVPWDGKREARYTFAVRDGARGVWLTQDGAVAQVDIRSAGLRDFSIRPSDLRAMPRPPAWVEDAVFYQIFPDRFENGDTSNDPPDVQPWDGEPTWFNWFGGDLAGLRKRVGHIESLGVNALYFNPVFHGPSNHRYETTDYRAIDKRLGTNEEFVALVKDLRRRRIRTVLDGVFNHTAVDFPPFADILDRQQSSRYLGWYLINSFPVAVRDEPPYAAWYGFPSMPKLNFESRDVRDMVLGVVDYWEREAGIDGWRLDVANEVPSDFWREFRARLKHHSPERWICGEIWGDGSPWLKGDQFDSVMNYRFREAVLGLVARRSLPPSAFMERLMQVHEGYGPQTSRNMMNLLGSHDTPRILTECGGDAARAMFAAQLQFAWVGAPCVYYGDELGMEGGRDPENRRGMEWPKAVASNPFLSLYRKLAKARQASPALRRGDPEPVLADDSAGLIAFRRVYARERALVLANASEAERVFEVSADAWGQKLPKHLADAFGDARVVARGSTFRVTIPALTTAVLAPVAAPASTPARRATDPGRSGPSNR